ncbi:MAG: hypothetical protein HGA80_06450 [Candidatus Omnitrophica bacterium]|nr:hypothetical protein [Candidatus Omnitrophota bacterium]
MKILRFVLIIVCMFSAHSVSADCNLLTKSNYAKTDGNKAIVIYGANWGRQWRCARFDNAQLQRLVFSRIDPVTGNLARDSIVLQASVELLAENVSRPKAIIVNPGRYALTGFDIRAAKSARDAGHIKGNSKELFTDGKPSGGTFEVSAGEIVYIGDFGLDCAEQPIPWRFYIQKEDFSRFVADFKSRYPFLADRDILYRLFETSTFGQ